MSEVSFCSFAVNEGQPGEREALVIGVIALALPARQMIRSWTDEDSVPGVNLGREGVRHKRDVAIGIPADINTPGPGPLGLARP